MRSKIYFCFLCFALLSACGGGSSTSTPPATAMAESSSSSSMSTTLTGTLTGAIQGLKYKTATQAGETNKKGEFNYLAGETVSFSIGDIKLPTVSAQEAISAYTLANSDALDNSVAMNITRLLQTLDLDGNYDNGIEITAMAHTMATGMSIDFSSARFVDEVANLASTSGGANAVLVNAETAQNNLLTSLSGCTKKHSTIGQVATLSTRSHGVAGQATIINDCTIKMTNFSFDGGGLDVYFYGGIINPAE